VHSSRPTPTTQATPAARTCWRTRDMSQCPASLCAQAGGGKEEKGHGEGRGVGFRRPHGPRSSSFGSSPSSPALQPPRASSTPFSLARHSPPSPAGTRSFCSQLGHDTTAFSPPSCAAPAAAAEAEGDEDEADEDGTGEGCQLCEHEGHRATPATHPLSHTRTYHAQECLRSRARTHTHTHSLSLSLSLSRARTHTHAHAHAHTRLFHTPNPQPEHTPAAGWRPDASAGTRSFCAHIGHDTTTFSAGGADEEAEEERAPPLLRSFRSPLSLSRLVGECACVYVCVCGEVCGGRHTCDICVQETRFEASGGFG